MAHAMPSQNDLTDRPPRTTRDAWLDLAIEALIQDGIDRVKVQIIAKKLDVSRSSFYFFFKSTKDLHDQMLELWLRKNTGPIIERAMRPADSVARSIFNVFECWVDPSLFDPQLDIAVRFWARRSATVNTVVAQADDQRVEALTKMFVRHGFGDEEALVRARVLYFTQVGHYTLEVPEDMVQRFTHVESYVRTFSGRDVPAKDLEAFRLFAKRFHPAV